MIVVVIILITDHKMMASAKFDRILVVICTLISFSFPNRILILFCFLLPPTHSHVCDSQAYQPMIGLWVIPLHQWLAREWTCDPTLANHQNVRRSLLGSFWGKCFPILEKSYLPKNNVFFFSRDFCVMSFSGNAVPFLPSVLGRGHNDDDRRKLGPWYHQ